MADITHLMNGTDYGVPRNWQDLEISIDWLLKKETGTINISDLEFVEEANKYLQKRILDGLTGGVGIFEGVPYTIKVGDVSNPAFTFEGYLDMTDSATVIGGEEMVLSLKKLKGDDWLSDVADGFSFAYLYDQGVIVNGDFKKVPYVINFVPDGTQLVLLSMSIYMMTKELIENSEKLLETIADVTNASTPVVGVSVGLGAGVVTAWDLGDFILVVLKALARIAYIIAMIVAIINLIEAVFQQVLPKKRYHLGMTFRKMFERSCQHLGMNFESDIDELSWIHIPRKTAKGGSSGETGFPSNSEPIYTFGDLIRTMKEMFNADYRIENNTLIFKRKDKFEFPSTYEMPDFFNDQERILDVNSFNTDEIISNYNINYSLDIQDQNTLEDSSGRVFQAVTSAVATINPDLVVIKNIAEIAIPFSLGKEKRSLTTVEEVAKVLASIVDGLTGIFGGGTNFRSQIENRIGSLLLSSHFTTSGKIVKMSGSKLSNNQRTELDALNLWNNFHYINSFAEYQNEHNQWFRYKNQKVPMTIENFNTLTINNKATDRFGNEYLIEKVIYVPESTVATIDFRVKRKYTNNLKIEFL
tara:strand:- start:12423 stop:14177 length:1755 start_codon:yes stop_codon:yes gene_type:complete